MISRMYEAYFGLRDTPFSITPNPRYMFMSQRHAEALAHLQYGVASGGGFIQLTGEVGTGKTMLVRCMLEELPAGVDVALIINPALDGADFLRAICDELQLPRDGEQSSHALMQKLNRHLLESHAAGRRTVLIVDEAQALPPGTLEQIRLLTNLETESTKLLQILLVGQPELRDTLARNDLRQLAQRITGRYHLPPLSRPELERYIRHRLAVAGAPGRIFTPAAVRAVHRASQGIPRLANVLCDRALLGAYTREQRRVSAGLIRDAGRQLAHPRAPRPRARWLWPALALLPAIAVAAGAAYWQFQPQSPAPLASTTQPTHKPGFDALLHGGQLRDGNHAAFAALFDRWQRPYRENGAPGCAQARMAGLQCLFYRGSWNTLRLLDRPAIITLNDNAGSPHQAVLERIDRQNAQLRFGERRIEVPLATLDHYFSGDFLLLWRPPDGVAPPLNPGDSGPGVVWLRQQLKLAGDKPDYTAGVADAVRQFQAEHGLATDGIAGARTLVVLLNQQAGGQAPRLTAPAMEKR